MTIHFQGMHFLLLVEGSIELLSWLVLMEPPEVSHVTFHVEVGPLEGGCKVSSEFETCTRNRAWTPEPSADLDGDRCILSCPSHQQLPPKPVPSEKAWTASISFFAERAVLLLQEVGKCSCKLCASRHRGAVASLHAGHEILSRTSEGFRV